jgi:tRNA C32,U32 (ribose-2'-O)-methylase TrmJ
MMTDKLRAKNSRKKDSIHDRYRRILNRPGLTDREIDEMRKNLSLFAQTICEHVWGKKFY